MIHAIVNDPQLRIILVCIVCLLVLASVAGAILSGTAKSASARAVIDNLNARTRAWWVMIFLVIAALSIVGPTSSEIQYS